MKPFKKRGFWVLFGFVVLVGAFFIVNLGLKNQSPVIPYVNAQMYGDYNNGGLYGGVMPHNIIFSSGSSPITQYGRGYGQYGRGYGTFPSDVMFGTGMGHPGSVIFADIHPGDVIIGSSNGKTEMRTIMTCNGCAQTTTTCDWHCGPTFIHCSTGNMFGESFTGLTCPGPTGLICGGGGNTNFACPTGMHCGSGGNSLMTCSSGGILCGVGGGNTSRTCDVFGCRASSASPIGSNTLLTCASYLSACRTALSCPRRQAFYGDEIGGIYGFGGMTRMGSCTIQLYGGIAPNPSPAY
jgi:hypothetical protein